MRCLNAYEPGLGWDSQVLRLNEFKRGPRTETRETPRFKGWAEKAHPVASQMKETNDTENTWPMISDLEKLCKSNNLATY